MPPSSCRLVRNEGTERRWKRLLVGDGIGATREIPTRNCKSCYMATGDSWAGELDLPRTNMEPMQASFEEVQRLIEAPFGVSCCLGRAASGFNVGTPIRPNLTDWLASILSETLQRHEGKWGDAPWRGLTLVMRFLPLTPTTNSDRTPNLQPVLGDPGLNPKIPKLDTC